MDVMNTIKTLLHDNLDIEPERVDTTTSISSLSASTNPLPSIRSASIRSTWSN